MRALLKAIFCLLAALPAGIVSSQETAKIAVNADTPVHLGSEPLQAYEALITAGVAGNIPLGIVLGSDRTLCSASIPQKAVISISSLNQLIAAFNENVPGYHAALLDGVLDVVPTAEDTSSKEMLSLRLSSFASPPTTMGRIAIKLWFAVQAVLHPDKGSAFAGGLSPAAEQIPALTLDGQTVEEILNKVVKAGHGGVWVFQTNALAPDAQIPFQIRSYIGEKELIQRRWRCGA